MSGCVVTYLHTCVYAYVQVRVNATFQRRCKVMHEAAFYQLKWEEIIMQSKKATLCSWITYHQQFDSIRLTYNR